MEAYFVLDTCGQPIRERDLVAWVRWFEHADRGIARTLVAEDVVVLTTFTGIGDVAEAGDEPLLFETRVFGGVLDGEEVRSRTRTEATAAHATVAQWCGIGKKEVLR